MNAEASPAGHGGVRPHYPLLSFVLPLVYIPLKEPPVVLKAPLSTECGKRQSMPVGRYCISSPTIALFHEDGRHVARTVPSGAFITASTPLNGERLVDVTWEGRKVMMFTQDLRSWAEQADRASRRPNVTNTMAEPDIHEVLGQFNQLITELLSGTLHRTTFRPWEIVILVDVFRCNHRGFSKRKILRKYQEAVQQRMQAGARSPTKLSEYLESLQAKRTRGAHGN
jgi:hypothetical protein